MGSGPETTTKTNEKQKIDANTNTSGTTGVQGTSLVQGSTLGQTYGQTAEQTQGQTANYQANNAWAPTEPILQDIISAAGQQVSGGLTADESAALSGLQQNAQGNVAFNPQLQDAAGYMLSGGGFGDGDQYVQSGWNSLNTALGATANGDNISMQSNPYLSGMLDRAQTDAMDRIGSQFAAAGRSFSGAHRDATADAMAGAALPHLFNNYQFERNAQADAGKALMSGGATASGALSNNRAGSLSAMQGAPSMLSATNDPYNTMLTGAQIGRQIPLDQLGKVSDLVMPMASQFGEQINLGSQSGSSTGQQFGTSAEQSQQLSQNDVLTMLQSLSNQKGTTTGSGTSVSQQQNDPLSTMLGAGVALGGAWLGSDRRMKRDITKVGQLDNGLPVYTFRYLDDDAIHMGLMADEVELVKPHAVATDIDGFKRVHYGLAGRA